MPNKNEIVTAYAGRLLGQAPPEELLGLARKSKFSPHRLNRDELARFGICRELAVTQLRQHRWYRRLLYRFVLALY